MTTKLPVIGSTAATTAFCSVEVHGPGGLSLWLDGNGKITAGNGTLAEPKPNAFSLVQIEDCPQSTPTCRASCLASFHQVLTADLRYVRLSDIKEGDKLVSFDEKRRDDERRLSYRTGTVLAVRHESAELFRITMSSGKQFWVTRDHRWLVRQAGGNHEWRYTDQLQPDISRMPVLFEQWESATSFEAGWLSGMYDGEGCLSHSGTGAVAQLTLSQKEGPVLERARRAIETVLGENSYTSTAQARDVAQLRITGGRLKVAKALGILRPTRLLAKFSPDDLGEVWAQGVDSVVSIEPGGIGEITLIDVDEGTMVVEGYGHHNCYVHNLEKAQKATHDLYRHNSQTIRKILDRSGVIGEHGMCLTMQALQWAEIVATWITVNAPHGFRWHVSGDVYSDVYASWIAAVCARSPDVRHWIYTRSFDHLGPLAGVSTVNGGNLSINLSCDQDNLAAAIEARDTWEQDGGKFRLCYLTVDGTLPDSLGADDVVFPDYALRPRAAASLADSEWWQGITQFQRGLVCPTDAHGKSETCRCGPCSRCIK